MGASVDAVFPIRVRPHLATSQSTMAAAPQSTDQARCGEVGASALGGLRIDRASTRVKEGHRSPAWSDCLSGPERSEASECSKQGRKHACRVFIADASGFAADYNNFAQLPVV